MNVALPGESHPAAFHIVLVIAILIGLAVAWWFYRRGWLSYRQGQRLNRHTQEKDNRD
jgi:hypothetical protein